MLENGLEALLIRDEKTDKASGALDVKVGHLADPEDLQGLAHFCEHLLFMGTEKVNIAHLSSCPLEMASTWAEVIWSGGRQRLVWRRGLS